MRHRQFRNERFLAKTWRQARRSLLAGGFVLGGLMVGPVVTADEPAEKPAAAEKAAPEAVNVEAVLRDEAAGKEVNRSELLDAAASGSLENAAAKWQAGYTRWKDKWVKFDAPATDTRLKEKLAAYERARDAAADTAVGQMALADWCKNHGMAEQERVHLMRVLALQSNHEAARARLGWKSIGGRWFSKDDIEANRRQVEATAKAAKEYLPRLKTAFNALSSRNPTQRQRAEKTLASFDDPALIPLLLNAMETASEDAQRKTVDQIRHMTSPVASVALARIAVANPYGSVGDEAAQALRSRPFDHYVPSLLAMMSTPVETKFVVDQIAGGSLCYRQLFIRETEDRKEELLVVHTVNQQRGPVSYGQAKQLADVGEDRTARLADVNSNIDTVNRNVSAVLNVATNQNLAANPDAWWKWWYSMNETFPSGSKPTYSYASYSSTDIPAVTPTLASGGGTTSAPHECLVAGTLIWTITGPRPVEQLKAGDLVLAQDPDSGALDYKAIVTPTKRPAGPVLRIETETDTIHASGGHPFWVSGEGWVRARVLKAGQRLHDIHGSTLIRSVVEENDPVDTFNLVVADFHSYFVGKGMVLSHDNSIRRPTSAKVPGLVAN